jgi:serine-type D-Ala-D-Ala carboxypeptidase/endopeptidase (penicillin-binding protein 4)
MKLRVTLLCCVLLGILHPGYSQTKEKEIGKWAKTTLFSKAMRNAHTGICIYEPATGKYWYTYQDDKYFTPASNTKIFTLYTGLKYLGDSLPGMRYLETDSMLYIKGTGDPSFLHPDYAASQPAMQLLENTGKRIALVPDATENQRYGYGWSWNDYMEDYQPELNEWPMYGNLAHVMHNGDTSMIIPAVYNNTSQFITRQNPRMLDIRVSRDERINKFTLYYGKSAIDREAVLPYVTGGPEDLALRLQDTLHKPVIVETNFVPTEASDYKMLQSIPADSLFTPMMHRSDNFFAEQTLMMCSSRLWDTISTARMIDLMEKTYLTSLPDTPHWVDGCGLSRYNLFTPRDFVSVLTSMYKEYPTERLYSIFPTGGKGTLRNYYKQQFVHAKTGTLTGVVSLSGYLVTKQNKTLVFSVLVNNHNNSATAVRKEIETFLTKVYEQY